jgi:uncharacterized damage-inducible protein DinB
MNADAFRQYYNYHFGLNRWLWNTYIVPLSQEKFTQPSAYSLGSVRNQIVHLMNVDNGWFSQLRGAIEQVEEYPETGDDRDDIRQHWNGVEQMMRDYLAELRDDMLLEKPWSEGEDKDLIMWQVLLHVVNHGTDHRAQILRLLNDLGVNTISQDYVFYLYG